MTLPRACRSLISPVVTETERQKKAKELPAQSSPSPLLLCVPLASSQCWAGPGQSSCRLLCAQLAVIRLFLLGGGGLGVVGEMVALCGGCRRGYAALLELRKRLSEERESTLVLFCNERMQRGLRLKDVCGSGLRICIHKQRMVLRILLSACSLSPRLRPAVVFCLLFC